MSSDESRNSIERLKKKGDLPLPAGKEDDKETKNDLNSILEPNEAALQITSPYIPEKVSTRKEKGATLTELDERSLGYVTRQVPEDIDSLKMVIHSPGGRVTSANKIAKNIEDNFENIEAYVPHNAKSGGTLISLTADEIVMSDMADIGPLDPQITTDDNQRRSAKDVREGYHQALENYQFKHPSEISAPEHIMMEDMNILEYQEASKSVETLLNYTIDILSEHDSISHRDAYSSARELIEGYPQHDFTLVREKAEEVLPEGMVVPENQKQEEMNIMRSWMDEYAFEESSNHAVVYHLPE